MTTATAARIRADWDTSITYDVIGEKDADVPVFVGREELLPPLVASICETRKRGTMLISGYRGSGKTTLLIEALRRAADVFRKTENGSGRQLLPLVLNVSEVAASLEQRTDATQRLTIDPRRLLVALLRSLELYRRRDRRDDEPALPAHLGRSIEELYVKATATEFTHVTEAGRERELTQTRQAELSAKVDNLLKAAPLFTGVATLAFAVLGWGTSPLVFKILAGIGALATVVLTVTWSRRSVSSEKQADRLSYRIDNSLQQIESDLKDLLQQLEAENFRTVVVLEELDKLDEGGDRQLDAVIRYFKNLFTQAPALFFFVTDKRYFDVIALAIRNARRQRSYAVEHTFFSSRIFVGRPGTRACLDYIRAILADAGDRAVIDGIYQPGAAQDGATSRPALDLLARVVLFRASNHLFDLKHELRRYVRQTEDGTVLLQFDVDMFPPEERALAKFQDLIVDKFRAFEIKGGRSYANEVLNDCLYSVFNQLGSAMPQPIADLLPRVGAEDAAAVTDSLDIAELQRIEQAVRSMLEDLHRGLAIAIDKTEDRFTWLPNAAAVFTPFRRLEEHEEELVRRLKRAAAVATMLAQRLGDQHPLAVHLSGFAAAKRARAVEVARVDSTVSLDAATQEQRELEPELSKTLAPVHDAHRSEAARLFGLRFSLLFKYEDGAELALLHTADGEPAESRAPDMGCVLVGYGAWERLVTDAVKFASLSKSARKLALVHIAPAGATAAECEQIEQGFATALQGIEDGPAVRVKALPLDETPVEEQSPQPALAWGTELGRELVALSYWATYSDKQILMDSRQFRPLQPALDEWLADPAPQDSTCFVNGATDRDLVARAFRRVLHDAGHTVVSLGDSGDEPFEIDDSHRADLVTALRRSVHREGDDRDAQDLYAPVVRRVLDDPATAFVASGSGPLIKADDIARHARFVYIGPHDARRFSRRGSTTVQLMPAGQFRSKGGVEGPSETQHLEVEWGQYDRSVEPAAAASGHPASSVMA